MTQPLNRRLLTEAEAAPLTTDPGLPPIPGGYPGTANNAARSDHQHELQPVFPGYPIPLPGLVESRHVFGNPVGRRSGTALTATGECPGTPLPVYRSFVLNTINYDISVAGDAGSVSVALYRCDPAHSDLPWGAPVWTSTPVSSTSTGLKQVTGLSVQLTPGMYTLFYGGFGHTATRTRPSTPGNIEVATIWVPQVTTTINTDISGLWLSAFDDVTGAWPTIDARDDFNAANANSVWWYALQGDVD